MPRKRTYRALISSDWNECLAPCGPFDVAAYHYPQLNQRLSAVFRSYTANDISLGEATRRVGAILPQPIVAEQMDAYLKSSFVTYTGVAKFMAWACAHDVLFMINTTGMIGYFQRALATGFLPAVPVLSAHPMVRYAESDTDPPYILELAEIFDKGRHTETVARRFGIPPTNVIVIGDSGGDGPHFQWGADNGARLVGSMIKPSLEFYCRRAGIRIDHRFGRSYRAGDAVDRHAEAGVDFMDLAAVVGEWLFSRSS